MVTFVSLSALDATWRTNWGEAPPLGYELRHWFGPQWVRFHTENLSELPRHSVVVEEMRTGAVFVIAEEFEPGDVVHGWLREAIPDARRWMPVASDDGQHSTVWIGPLLSDVAELEQLLELIADDATGSVIIADESLSWLYHPYDRGGDLIAPSRERRDAMAARHVDWLSPREDGL